MDDNKVWWQSKTVWGSVLAFLATALSFFGVSLDVGFQAEIVNFLMALIGAGLAIYGRFVASAPLKATLLK
jgi:hypothetical protein